MYLQDYFRDWRNRTISNPAFQRWAAAFPFTRRIAGRHSRDAFDLVAGFVYSQVLAACVRLKVFQALASGARSVTDLANEMDLRETEAARLLKAAAALNLVEQTRPGVFALGSIGAAIGANAGILAMIEHHALLYADLADPVALLRGEAANRRLTDFWKYASGRTVSGDDAAPYSQLMGKSQTLIASDILTACPLDRHHTLLDIGGGQGMFAIEACKKFPRLSTILFDLPAVARRAEDNFLQSGLAGRANAIGGSFIHDPLPGGADVASLVRVLHDHDDSVVEALLPKIRASLPTGGKLLIAEPMSGTPGAQPVGDAYFGFYLLAMGSGRPRTPAEYKDFLTKAGFRNVRQHRTLRPLLVQVLVAIS